MIFEAYKIITPVKSEYDSACDVLDPPILVARASATGVVIKEKQRKTR